MTKYIIEPETKMKPAGQDIFIISMLILAGWLAVNWYEGEEMAFLAIGLMMTFMALTYVAIGAVHTLYKMVRKLFNI